MDTRIPRKYFLIPLLYILIILGMLYLQFGNAIPFRDSYKGIEISGKQQAGVRSKNDGLSQLRLEYGEFSLVFGNSQNVALRLEDGGLIVPGLAGYAKFPDRLEVRFHQGFTLFFMQPAEDGPILVSAEYGEAAIASLELPFQLRNPSELEWMEGFPVLYHPSRSSADGYFVSLPMGSRIDLQGGMLQIKAEQENRLVVIQSSDSDSIVAYWFSNQPVSVSPGELQASIQSYLDKSYRGWKISRYNRQTASWRGNSASIVSEELINSYGSEAFSRGEGFTFVSQVVPALAAKSGLTFLSNPFVGNIVDTYFGLRNRLEESSGISQPDDILNPELFASLLRFRELISPSVKERYRTLFSEGVKDRGVDSRRLVVYSAYLLQQLFPEFASSQDLIRGIEEVILPALVPYGEGYIFESLEGVSDGLTGILAGLVLAQSSENDLYANLGRALVVGYLEMADNAGLLPRELVKSGESWSPGSEFLFPEELYFLIAQGDYRPRVVDLGEGIWAWSNSQKLGLVARGNQIVVSSTFPVDGIYHLTISGIKPFTSIRMFGIPWKSDPQFQRYTSGWVYRPDTQTLFLKIRQRRPVESIVIDYTPVSPDEGQEP